jgi:hypothetical protein
MGVKSRDASPEVGSESPISMRCRSSTDLVLRVMGFNILAWSVQRSLGITAFCHG